MNTGIMTGITLVLVLGIGAQWLAWRVKMPSILLLLVTGFAVGPLYALVTGGAPLIDPDTMMGEMLFPVVSVSVAVILFEGGLTLKFSELKKVGGVVVALVTAGAAATWIIITAAAELLLGFNREISLLVGAILVVTGPTVIGPLLQDVRPRGDTKSILKWEGIVIDPIGAILAVLVFEYIIHGGGHEPVAVFAKGAALVMGAGILCGLAGAALLYIILKRYWIPDFLQSPAALMLAVGSFAVSNLIAAESGLVAVTVMGVALANQKSADIGHISEFKENLRVILISSLFVLLAARIDLSLFRSCGPSIILFLLVLIFVARPAAVAVSTLFSKLTMKERAFLAWMAPRGIVAAAVSSIFAMELTAHGVPQADRIVPVVFVVIVVTVMLYGLTAGPLAKMLGIKQSNPQGLLILGTGPFAQALAEDLVENGIRVLLIDNDITTAGKSRMGGLPTFFGNILNRHTLEHLDLDGIGKLLAMSSNDEVNSLASVLYSEVFGRGEVYQVKPNEETDRRMKRSLPLSLEGRYLFSNDLTLFKLEAMIAEGADIKTTKLTEKFTFDDFRARYTKDIVPLMVINEKGETKIFAVDEKLKARPGHKIVALVYPEQVPDNGVENEKNGDGRSK